MIVPDSTNPIFLAWVAAWLEGEGCLSLFKRSDIGARSYQIKISISQANTWPLEIIHQGFPFGRIGKPRKNGVSNLSYASTKAIDFLIPLLPYLTFKRIRAEILIEAQAIISRRYNRWHARPQEEVDRLEELKNKLHEITKTSLKTRQKQIGGRSNKLIDKWSHKHNECIECKSTVKRHRARGYCTRCYSRLYGRVQHNSMR